MNNKNRPNIVIIMPDQQRADFRKSEGFPLDTMPFVDSLGQMGVDFERAYTSTPTCVPARVSMLTGRYSMSHLIRTNKHLESAHENDAYYYSDMIDMLKRLGYFTILCGKNHSHRDDYDKFLNINHAGGHNMEATKEELEVEKWIKKNGSVVRATKEATPFSADVLFPARNINNAINIIDSLDSDKPFFLWVSFVEPHNPIHTCEPYFSMFEDNVPHTLTKREDLDDKMIVYKQQAEEIDDIIRDENEREENIKRTRSTYCGMMRQLDDEVKRLYRHLEERGRIENTHFIYISDHGDFTGDYDLLGKGPGLSEMLCKIPFIWKGPSVLPQGRINQCVSIVDIFPTFCDILGEEIPEGVQGRSLFPILTKDIYPENEFSVAYVEDGYGGLYWKDTELNLWATGCRKDKNRFDGLNTFSQAGARRMIRKGDFKLVCDMMGDCWMYNLKDDPYERNNLFNDIKFLNIKIDMLREMAAAILRAQDPLPMPHKRYRVKRHPKNYWFDKKFFIKQDPGISSIPAFSKVYNHISSK